jgi:hypothetical protein
MNVLNITYKGQGSEKQVAWAADIFNKKMNSLKADYEAALERVARGNMPESFKAAWELVLNDERAVKFVEMVANTDAKTIIDFKGNVGSKCFVTIINTLVNHEYNKAV